MEEKNTVEEYLEEVYPEHGKLQVDEKGSIFTVIVDAEMDGFVCRFNYDGCVHIETEKMGWIDMDRNTLIHLAKLIEEADEIYSKRTEEEWAKYE